MRSSSNQPVSSSAPGDNANFPSRERIDASCRGSLMFLFTASVLWLFVSSLFAFISSMKMHAPGMLADQAWLTYGRVRPAAVDMFLYGFASQGAIAVALWILCRLGKSFLVAPGVLVVGAVFWNLGVLLGVAGIFAGHSTGYEWLEFPSYAVAILFVSYLVMGVVALLTFAYRNQRESFASQWFILAAFFIFPWLLSTAGLLLLVSPVRGAAQAAINYWYMNGFLLLWLMPMALGIIFYMVSKVSERALSNHYLAGVSFWLWVVIAGWCGIPVGARLPAWMPAVSTAASILLLVPAFAILMNWRSTWIGSRAKENGGVTFKFITFSAFAFVLTVVAIAAGALPGVARAIEFTLFTLGIGQLAIYGCIAMALFGGMYFIIPRITGSEWTDKWIKRHFILSALGLVLILGAWCIGGVKQGRAWEDALSGFMVSVQGAVPFIGIGTLGFFVLLIAHFLFLSNLISLIRRCCTAWCGNGKEARK